MSFNPASSYTTGRLDLGVPLNEYVLTPDEMIGFAALPGLSLPKESAVIPIITREHMLRLSDGKRSRGGDYNRVTAEFDELSYRCEEYGHEQLVGDDDRSFYASDFDADFQASTGLASMLMRGHEKRVADLLFNTSTWTGSDLYTDVSTVWSTVSSDIIGDVNAAKLKVSQLTGMACNALILSETAFNYLKSNTAISNSVIYTRYPSDAQWRSNIAELLGLDYILIGKSRYNSASEGIAASTSALWSASYAMVARIANPGATLTEPCLGRTIIWEPDSGSGPYVVESYRDDKKRGDVIRVRHNVDEKVFDPYFAHLMKID